MFGSRDPPPGNRHPGHHGPGVALLLRALLEPYVHEFQSLTLWLQPEVEGILLLGHVLGVEEHVGEKAVAVDAAHEAYVFERELQVLASPIVLEGEYAAVCLHVLLHGRPHSGAHLLLGDLLHTALCRNASRSGKRDPYQATEAKCVPSHDVILHMWTALSLSQYSTPRA